MRKSSKLLAVLLTLCLLFGAITAIVASAADGEATDQLKVGDKTGYTSANPAEVSSTANRTMSGANLIDILPTTADASGYKYVTIDMDFYINDDAATATPTTFWQLMNVTANTDAGSHKDFGAQAVFLVYNATEKAYFWSLNSTLTEGPSPEAKASAVTGIYDHLTYVLQFDNNAADGKVTVTTSIYINGTFIGSKSATTTTQKLQISRPATKSTTWNGNKIGVANFVLNYFKDGTDNTKALEKALENRAPLYNFEGHNNKLGVVYNSTYVTPDAAINYVKINNGTPYTLVGKALDEIAKIQNNAEIEVSGRNLAGVTVPAGLQSFTVKCTNGGSFSLSADCAYIGETVGDTTTYAPVSADVAYVTINGGEKIDTVEEAMEAISNISDGAEIEISYMQLTDVVILGNVKSFTVKLLKGAAFDADAFFVEEATAEENVYTYRWTAAGDYTTTFWTENALTSNNNCSQAHFATENYAAKKNLKLFDYIVYDFEMTVTSGKSFPSNLVFKPNVTTNTPSDGNLGLTWISAVNDDGNYYLGRAIEEAKLSNDATKFDQITIVYEIGKDAEGNLTSITYYVFVNKNYILQSTKAITGDYSLARLQIQDTNGWSNEGLTFKNFKVHSYYSKDANITGTGTKLDGTTASGAQAAKFEKCLETEGGFKITVDEVPYINVAEALAKVENGSTITLNNVNLSGFNKDLDNFDVICDDKSSFKFANSCGWKYYKNGDTYTKIMNDEIKANVNLGSIFQMEFNVYVPFVEGVEIEAVYTTATGTSKDASITTRIAEYDTDGNGIKEKYFVITWLGRIDYVTHDTKIGYVEFKYTASEGADPITLAGRFNAKFNYIQYAQYVAEEFDCDSEEVKLVRAMTEYRAALHPFFVEKFKDNPDEIVPMDQAALNKFYAECEKHKDTDEACTCSQTVVPEANYIKVGTAHNSEHKGDVTFGLSGRGAYLFIAGTKNQRVVISYTDVHGTLQTRTADVVVNADESTGKAKIADIAITDIDNDFTITVYNVTPAVTDEESGEIVTKEIVVEAYNFKYSLADFATTDGYATIVAALQKLAIAAENFKKYVPTTTTTPEAGE